MLASRLGFSRKLCRFMSHQHSKSTFALPHGSYKKTQGILIGAACKNGQRKNGVDLAPISITTSLGTKSDIYINSHEFDNGSGYQSLYNVVTAQLKHNDKKKIVVLGGDHSVALGSITAINDHNVSNGEELYIIWIDAHADINTYETSLTGNIHGMPAAFLLGLCKQPFVKFKHIISPQNIIYVGLRDLDMAEWKFLSDLNIKYYVSNDVKSKGIDTVINEIKQLIGKHKVHISLDIDGIDPLFTPSTGTVASNGLSLNDVTKIISSFEDNQNSTIDIVEYNPLLGTQDEISRTLNSIKICYANFMKNANFS